MMDILATSLFIVKRLVVLAVGLKAEMKKGGEFVRDTKLLIYV